jgi:putative ABC transport system permease protein
VGLFDTLHTALESLAHNKLRSLLTTLGVIIGVASVIVTLALGTGAQEAVKEQFRGLGSNVLTVFPAMSMGDGGRNPGREARPITYEEAQGLKDLSHVNQVKISLGGGGTLVFGRESLDTNVLGVPTDWLADMPADYIAQGEFFDEYDVEDAARVAVIGQTLVRELFPDQDPLGQQMRINRVHFLVIGVIKELGRPDPRVDPNNQVLVPITAAASLFGKDRSVSVQVRVLDEKEIEGAIEAIKNYFREVHEIEPEEEVDVEVFNPREVTQAQREAAETFALLLVGLAVVSLVVGGIGIMNVMLVSVMERTREIGVRLALGASRWDIVRQFLIEAVALGLSGGMLGVAVGILAIPVLSRYRPDLSVVLTWRSIPMACGVALAVGIVFGLYPAVRASRLDPVEALRYE